MANKKDFNAKARKEKTMRRIIRRIIIKTSETLHITNDANVKEAHSPKVCPLCNTPLVPSASLPFLPANTSSAVADKTNAAAELLAAGDSDEKHNCSDAQ